MLDAGYWMLDAGCVGFGVGEMPDAHLKSANYQ
jgi:hypothetical protein